MIKYLFFTVLMLIVVTTKAQCDFNVSTDPDNPTNDNLPVVTAPLSPNYFLNDFHWLAPVGGVYNEYATDNMLNLTGQTMENAFGSSAGSYYNYIYDPAVYLPPVTQNGWELVSVNLGYFPDGTTFAQANLTSSYADLPYIIFYNRYKGIIRLFANSGLGISQGAGSTYDAVKVTLRFDNNDVSGIFRLNDGVDRTLDQTTDVKEIVALTKHPNSYRKWFSADFQVTYDPCVCYYPSNLRFDFEFVQQQNIELIGRSVAVESDLVIGAFANDLDFLTNFEYDITAGASSGLIMHKKLNTLVDDYIAKMEAYKAKLAQVQEYNAKVERNLAIVKTLDKVIDGAVTAVTGVPIDLINDSQLVTDLETWANDIIQHHAPESDTIDIDVLLAEGQKALQGSVDNFISEKFKKVAEPSKPISPSATFTEMHFKGKVTQTSFVPGPRIFNPGTYGNSSSTSMLTNVLEYPVYNEALGVFALLEKPKLEISQTLAEYTCEHNFLDTITAWSDGCGLWDTIEPSEYNSSLKYEVKQNWTKLLKFKLADELKYVINPTLDVKEVNIDASIILNVHTDGGSGGGIWQANNSALSSVNVESTSINPNDATSFLTSDTVTFTSVQVPIDALNNFVGGVGVSNQNTRNEYYNFQYPNYVPNTFCTDYYSSVPPTIPDPCSSGEPTSASGGSLNDFEYLLDNAQLKLTVNITYNTVRTDGDPHEYTYVFTYDIDPGDIYTNSNDLYPNLEGSVADFGDYPRDINFGDVNFDGNEVEGCTLQGSHYTCKSWNDVRISGDVISSNGYTADIIAGNIIETFPESSVSPEVTLSIEPVIDYSNPTPPATISYVSNFCQGLNPNAPAYQAKIPTKLYPSDQANTDEELEPIENQPYLNAQLYPNPATNIVNINMVSTTGEDVVIELVDMAGQVLETSRLSNANIVGGNNVVTMSTAAYASGYYFINVKSGSISQTEKLIIQK